MSIPSIVFKKIVKGTPKKPSLNRVNKKEQRNMFEKQTATKTHDAVVELTAKRNELVLQFVYH